VGLEAGIARGELDGRGWKGTSGTLLCYAVLCPIGLAQHRCIAASGVSIGLRSV